MKNLTIACMNREEDDSGNIMQTFFKTQLYIDYFVWVRKLSLTKVVNKLLCEVNKGFVNELGDGFQF